MVFLTKRKEEAMTIVLRIWRFHVVIELGYLRG